MANLDPYATEAKLLAISSPCGAPPAYPAHADTGNCCAYHRSETMRRVDALADLLRRECPLRELLGAVRETEGDK